MLCYCFSSRQSAPTEDWQTATSIYNFSATDIDGNVVSLEKYRYVCLCRGFPQSKLHHHLNITCSSSQIFQGGRCHHHQRRLEMRKNPRKLRSVCRLARQVF